MPAPRLCPVPYILLLLLFSTLIRAACYWQNSTQAPDDPYSIAASDTPCFPDQEHSPCCGNAWTCLSDGVCYIEQGDNAFYYRGTCTDRLWNSQQCPGWCFAQDAEKSIPLVKCPGEKDWYCCPGDNKCSCDTGDFAVILGAEQPTTVTVIGSTTWPGIAPTTAGFTEQPLNGVTTAATETATHTETRLGESVTRSASLTGSPAAVSVSGSGADSVESNSDGNKGSSNTGLAAGLGAGLGAAAVIIAGLAYYVIRSRRRKRTEGRSSGGFGAAEYLNEPKPTVEVPGERGYRQGLYHSRPIQGTTEPSELPAGVEGQRAELHSDGRISRRAEMGP